MSHIFSDLNYSCPLFNLEFQLVLSCVPNSLSHIAYTACNVLRLSNPNPDLEGLSHKIAGFDLWPALRPVPRTRGTGQDFDQYGTNLDFVKAQM